MGIWRGFKGLSMAAALVAVSGVFAPAQAFDAVTGGPIAADFDVSIRDCRDTGSLRVPMITWGADIVTLHAAGGDVQTQPGSAFNQAGLDVTLYREDNFLSQLSAYLACETPFLRATLGMANLVADITEADPRTKMIAIYQHSWSAGGDAMVVRAGIDRPADLKGATIALQKGGPHVDYLLTILRDAGIAPDEVTLVWTEDLVGLDGSTPSAALLDAGNVDAAMVILPDALALTSGGTVGTGAEGSLNGGRILLSTKTANRVIADLYLVRSDWYAANTETAAAFAGALLQAEEQVRDIVRGGGSAEQQLMTASATVLLDSAAAIEDARGLWADAETVGASGNIAFFDDPAFPRGFERLVSDVQSLYRGAGLMAGRHALAAAGWDWSALASGAGLTASTAEQERERFNSAGAAAAIGSAQAQGTIDDNTLFEFEIRFKPNQQDFPETVYADDFSRVSDLAATYGGAVISIEGHADPLGYLRAKKGGESDVMLRQRVQSTRNLSVARAQSVRNSVITAAETQGVWMDPSQFVIVGRGIESPRTGMCGADPCAPSTEAEWLSNMRVVFRVVNVEAEASAFVPLD